MKRRADVSLLTPGEVNLQLISRLWEEILQLPGGSVQPNSHFLLLGGDSLHLARILNRLYEDHDITGGSSQLAEFSTPTRMLDFCLRSAQLETAVKAFELIPRQGLDLSSSQVTKTSLVPSQYFPATAVQQGIWFAEKLAEGHSLYVNAVVLSITGQLSIPALHWALAAQVARHPVLRATYALHGTTLQGCIANTSCSGLRVAQTTLAKLGVEIKRCLLEPFNLEHEMPCRFELLCLTDTAFRLVLCFHHIAADGWSGAIFLQQLASLYKVYSRGEHSTAEPMDFPGSTVAGNPWGYKHDADFSYPDYAHRLNSLCISSVVSPSALWWQQYLDRADSGPSWLKTQKTLQWPYRVDFSVMTIPAGLIEAGRVASAAMQCSLFSLMLAAAMLALYRDTKDSQICVGVPVSDRKLKSEEHSIGCYMDLLPQVSGKIPEPINKYWLENIQANWLLASTEHRLPLQQLHKLLHPGHLPDNNIWFSTLFAYQNMPVVEPALGGLNVQVDRIHHDLSQYALKLEVLPGKRHWLLRTEFASTLFNQSRIDSLSRHFLAALQEVSEIAQND